MVLIKLLAYTKSDVVDSKSGTHTKAHEQSNHITIIIPSCYTEAHNLRSLGTVTHLAAHRPGHQDASGHPPRPVLHRPAVRRLPSQVQVETMSNIFVKLKKFFFFQTQLLQSCYNV